MSTLIRIPGFDDAISQGVFYHLRRHLRSDTITKAVVRLLKQWVSPTHDFSHRATNEVPTEKWREDLPWFHWTSVRLINSQVDLEGEGKVTCVESWCNHYGGSPEENLHAMEGVGDTLAVLGVWFRLKEAWQKSAFDKLTARQFEAIRSFIFCAVLRELGGEGPNTRPILNRMLQGHYPLGYNSKNQLLIANPQP